MTKSQFIDLELDTAEWALRSAARDIARFAKRAPTLAKQKARLWRPRLNYEHQKLTEIINQNS